MHQLYNISLIFIQYVIRMIAIMRPLFSRECKIMKFAGGQSRLLAIIREEMAKDHEGERIWIHAASLGEYGVARPIIRQIKQKKSCSIVLTFFSPTGYEAVCQCHSEIDHVFYLPFDTPGNARTFLDIVCPEKAVFMISEYWINYLTELRKRKIETFLVSAIINRSSSFFRWYGGMFRDVLTAYTHFMVLNEKSKTNMKQLGMENVTVTGDPLFDNVTAVSQTLYSNPIVERFAAQGPLFIAGSISDCNDVRLVCGLANKYRNTHFLIVPHEICEENLNELKYNLEGKSLFYSECDEDTSFDDTQVLIIDFLGTLAYLYRYGRWAYVGGGFTPYLHSIIEATVYGLPVSFGPRVERKVTPVQLTALGIGEIVRTKKELITWFESIKENEELLEEIRQKALAYTEKNSGATSQIVNIILQL